MSNYCLKNIRKSSDSLILSFLFCFLGEAPSPSAAVYWISPTGSDTHPGTETQPWATIGKARDYIRENNLNSNQAVDITVNIKSGEYLVSNPIRFIPADSGSNGHYVIYKAVDGPGTANLVGSADINGWTLHSGNIWKVNVGAGKDVRTIYENGVRGRLARHPNYIFNARYPLSQAPYAMSTGEYGGYDSTSGCDWFQYNPGEFSVTNFTTAAQVAWWVAGGRNWSMVSQELVLNDVVANRLYFKQWHASYPPAVYGGAAPRPDRYFVAGIQSYLDRPGEFFYSKTDGWLYYYPRIEGDPSSRSMRVPLSTSSALIATKDGSSSNRVHHLKFEGITFAYTSYGLYEDGTVNLQYSDHVEVLNCRIHNVGRAGIQMINDNNNNLVYGCWISHCGVGGIWVRNNLLRSSNPNDKSEYNIISNCKIHDLGEIIIDGSLTTGVALFNTSDCEVSFCEIYNSGRYATSLRGHWSTERAEGQEDTGKHFSKNNVFKYIRAIDCMQDSGDGGIIHAAHCNGLGDPNGTNNVNYWQQMLISGAYADPSMQDAAPDGIFFDHPQSCLYQNLSNIQVEWIAGDAYRGNNNPVESQTTSNVSFTGNFDENLIQYSKIGLKLDFPFVYTDQATFTCDDRTIEYKEEEDILEDKKGWWTFDNSGEDASGSGHTATLHNVGYSKLYADGSASAYFNGTGHVEMDDHSDLNIGAGNFTVSLWYYREASDSPSLRILSKGAESDSDTGYCAFGSNSGASFILCNGSSRRVISGAHAGTNVWNHFVATVDRSGYMTIYINGVQRDTKDISDWQGLNLSNSRKLNIGRSVTSGGLYWLGRIDEVIIFQRTLSPSEVGALFRLSSTTAVDTKILGLFNGDGHYAYADSWSARWTPVFPFTRNYEVFIWKMALDTNASAVVPYTIYYQGGSTNVYINQQTGSSQAWASVGTYPFVAGRSSASGSVKISADTADGKVVRADAVKFVESSLFTSGTLGEEKGWWGFEQTGADASGNGHTAALNVGYSTISQVGTYSAHFDGSSSVYANVSDHPDLDIGTGDFAISLWFYRESGGASNLRVLSKGAEYDTDRGYCIFASDTQVYFVLCNGVSRKILIGAHLGTNAWNHVVVNVSRTGYMTLYINGAEASKMNISDWRNTDLSNSRDLHIGRGNTGLTWIGRIDDLAIFQRLLSDAEIF